MSSSSRWNRTSAAASSDQAQSSNRGQEYHSSGIDASGTHSAHGYALRRSEEIPADQFRTPSKLPKEDHLAFSNGCRRRNRLVSSSRESEEEERQESPHIDGTTQHEVN